MRTPLAVLILALASFPAMGVDQPEIKPARTITLDVLIADLPDGAAAAPTAAAVLEMEKAGKLAAVARLRLSVLENQQASVHFGELVPRMTGRTIAGGGGAAFARSMPNFTDIAVGTKLQAFPRVEDDGAISVMLNLSRSRLVPSKAAAEGAEETRDWTPSAVATLTIESTVKVRPGEPVLLGGREAIGKEAAQTWVVVTASLGGNSAASGKPAAPGGKSAAVSGKSASAEGPVQMLTIVRLKHAYAPHLAAVLSDVFSREPLVIGADARSNSLLIRAPRERMETVQALAGRLDTER